jgi:ABC-2 type transport system permease protein
MIVNIFFREMKANFKSLFIWSFGIAALVFTGLFKYDASIGSGQSMNSIASKLPDSIRAVMGLGFFDLSKASGYYGVLFVYLAVMAAIHSSMLGSSIICKEERDKTSEFLFAKPCSRNRIVTAKLLAASINLLILNLATLASSISAMQLYGNGENINRDIYMLMTAMFILQLLFLLIGSLSAAISKNPGGSAPKSAALLFFTFLISTAIDIDRKLEFLSYITPFKYFEAKDIMYGGSFNPVFLILSLALCSVLLAGTYLFFNKRDLYL